MLNEESKQSTELKLLFVAYKFVKKIQGFKSQRSTLLKKGNTILEQV